VLAKTVGGKQPTGTHSVASGDYIQKPGQAHEEFFHPIKKGFERQFDGMPL
jgi:hypothetical protein